MKWAEELKKEYGKIAKENQGDRNDFVENVPQSKGKVRDQIAKDLDLVSGRNYDKAQYIYNNAPEDIIGQLDDGQLSINKAYITLKEQLKSEKEKANQLEQQLKQEQSKSPKVIEKEIDNTDYHKIDELQDKIKKYDNES